MRAESAESLGRYSEAAELWQQAALDAAGSARDGYRLRAADAWLQAGEPVQTARRLAEIDDGRLSGDTLALFSLLHAELALQSMDLARADFYLDAAARFLAPSQQVRYRDLMQRASRLRGDPTGFALTATATALRAMERYDTHAGVALLQLLEDLPSGFLDRLPQAAETASRLDDWPQLAVTMRRALVSGANLEDVANAWTADHPGHVVSGEGFLELARAYRELFQVPTNIAVLLPDEGGLGAAGAAIRDGLIGAFLQAGAEQRLRFYPTADHPESAVSAYFAAVNDGAEWIIGPLRRESVEALSGLGSLGVPFLMLNNPPDGSTLLQENLVYSLALSQEMEARAIARKALTDGMHAAIALSADTPWGQRMEAEFSEAFRTGGGQLLASARFNPAESDHSDLLTRLLQIDQSQGRKDRLQATLGISLSFEPTRRDDFDLIFLAAEPGQGRQIRPQLRFHDTGSKPVLAMGRIYSGALNPDLDLDLNGITFPTTHWHLSQAANDLSLSSVRNGTLGSLHDLGVDAWRLLPWLPLLRKDPDLRMHGALGELFMDGSGRIHRDPVWARFERGVPAPLANAGE